MHIDILDVIKWFIAFIVQGFPFFKGMMDTTKQAGDALEAGQKIAKVVYRAPDETPTDDEPDVTPDQAAERVYAISHLIRSYSRFGIIESITWIAKMAFCYLLIAKWIDYLHSKYK